MMRWFPHVNSFKVFYALVGLTFVGLLAIGNLVRPLSRQDPSGSGESRPEMRVPLMVTGQDEALALPMLEESPAPPIMANATSKLAYGYDSVKEKLLKAKAQAEKAKSLNAKIEQPPAKEEAVEASRSTGLPPRVKEDDSSVSSRRKVAKRVKITYDNPDVYKGPFVEGWPPSKDRYMPRYIRPDEDTFPIRPPITHFFGCNLLVIVHSTIDAFNDRMGVRDTWLQYVTQNRVQNVSVIFLIGNQNAYGNVTELTK